MKRSAVIIALSVGLAGSMAFATSASAASWHSGVPTKLRNTSWKAKKLHEMGRTSRATIKFGTKALRYTPAFAVGKYNTYKIKYKYLGNHVYYLRGRVYGNAPAGGVVWNYKAKYYNAHKIYAKDLTFANHQYSDFVFTR